VSGAPGPRERILVWLLRLGAVTLFLAFPTMLQPVSSQAATHDLLGMGEFPVSPVVDYLTRSIAALYGFHGGLLLLVSFDVRRYRPVVVYLAFMNVVLGLMLLAIDLHAGLPFWWSAGEGPGVTAMGLALAWLVRAVPSRP